jgi:glycosyltransferase involved in cell wall biosynthesis
MPDNKIVLGGDVQETIAALKEVDILIGVPSYNNSRTVVHVVKAVEAGLSKYFSTFRSLLVNSDGGSTDGTRDIVKATQVDLDSILIDQPAGGVLKLVTPYHGIPGKGSAFRTVFEIARRLNVRVFKLLKLDKLFSRLGITESLQKIVVKDTLTKFIGRIFFWLIVIIFFIIALNALKLPASTSSWKDFFSIFPTSSSPLSC